MIDTIDKIIKMLELFDKGFKPVVIQMCEEDIANIPATSVKVSAKK